MACDLALASCALADAVIAIGLLNTALQKHLVKYCKSFAAISVRGHRQGQGDRQGPKQPYRSAMGKRDRFFETTPIGLFSPLGGGRK
jgi:hypothetical protein